MWEDQRDEPKTERAVSCMTDIGVPLVGRTKDPGSRRLLQASRRVHRLAISCARFNSTQDDRPIKNVDVTLQSQSGCGQAGSERKDTKAASTVE